MQEIVPLSGPGQNSRNKKYIPTSNRVARGNFTPRPSQIHTLQSPVIRLLSSCRCFQRLCLTSWLLPSLVDQKARPDDPTPSLHLHYRDFNTPESWSASALRIGTLALVGPPESEQKQYGDRRLPPLQDPFKIIPLFPIKTNEAISPDHCGAPEVFPST
jgi:hypothetical protein